MNRTSPGSLRPNWSWKPSDKVQLALKRGNAKVKRAASRHTETTMDTTTTTETTPAAKTKPSKARKVAKKAAAPAKAEAKTSTGTPLKTIAAQCKVDPRIARRRLRNADLSWHDSRDRWTFAANQVNKVKAIIKGAEA